MDAWIRAETLIQSPPLQAVAGLQHAVTTRAGGVSRAPFDTLNVGLGSADDAQHVNENRRRVASALGFAKLVTPYQVHGSDACVVTAAENGRPRCDALITNEPGVLLGVLGADCPGVLLVNEPRHVLAVVHAGWRGVASGIVTGVVRTMARTFGCRAEDTRALIGPSIGTPRYEVSDEVVDAIRKSLPAQLDLSDTGIIHATRPGHAQLALQETLRTQLTALGLRDDRLAAIDLCTYERNDRFYSYRRDGARTGRHALVAGFIE